MKENVSYCEDCKAGKQKYYPDQTGYFATQFLAIESKKKRTGTVRTVLKGLSGLRRASMKCV